MTGGVSNPSGPWAVATLVIAGLLSLVAGCNAFDKGRVEENLVELPVAAETVDGNAPVLKAHMNNGDVYVFRNWEVREQEGIVRGEGVKYTLTRHVDSRGIYRLPIDAVAVFETNVLKPSGGIIGLTVIAGISAVVSGFCLASTKSCFGSCPTFYAEGRDPSEVRPGAEAFSHAVTPSLESTDLDRLSHLEPSGDDAVVRMTNEAMETHVVRRLELLAAEVPDGWDGGVLQTTDEKLRAVSAGRGPSSCRARTGDCRGAMRAQDGRSWSSEADPEDLTTRETVEMTYRAPDDGRVGMAISFRQTFITTFLFYQFLSDLGPNAVDFIARFERSDDRSMRWFRRARELMGGIEVEVRRDGEWTRVGEVWEAGPIADNTRLLMLPKGIDGETKVRLRLAKGNWRIDAARMVQVGPEVTPKPLELTSASYDGEHPEGAVGDPVDRVTDSERTLVTRRGDAYTFRFERPDDSGGHTYFLRARGYYLEWMRARWLESSNPWRATQMLTWPARALRQLAPTFKEREAKMEQLFWDSRYVPNE